MRVSGSETGGRSSAFTGQSVPEEYERRLAPAVFEPWAEVLLDTVVVAPGSRVLDVASGTGVIARAAALRAGRDGQVTASDVSRAMLAHAAEIQAGNGAAPIVYREAPADALPFADASFDVVLCQQGLQFFPARAAALGEMRRVLRPGGVVGIAVWAEGHPLEPFGVYGDELAVIGAEPPFPNAFVSDSFVMGLETVRSLLEEAGFSPVEASVVELQVSWPDVAAVVAGVFGTPFGPVVQALASDQRQRYEAALVTRFTPERARGPVHRQTAAVIARATVA